MERMNQLTSSACGATFASARISSGKKEAVIQLHRPGCYPQGFIGPVRVLWAQEQLIIWAHPSIKEELVELLKDLFEAENEKLEEEDLVTYEGNDAQIEVLDTELNRFSLCGPKSLKVLADSIRLKEDEEFCPNHTEWASTSKQPIHQLADGTIFTLMVEDPRTCWGGAGAQPSTSSTESDVKPQTHFWKHDVRKKALEDRLSPSEYQKLNGERINGVVTTAAKVPLTVIVRNRGSGILNGLDVISPSGFGSDLWISLQRRGACASAANDEIAAAAESKRFVFPRDAVGSAAGKHWEQQDEQEQHEKHLSRPHNRRTKFWADLSVMHPFRGNWEQIVKQPFVCREPHLLRYFKRCVLGLESFSDNPEYSGMLLPVSLEPMARGRPKRLGLICIPTPEDLTDLRKNARREIIQPPRHGDDVEDVEMEDVAVQPKKMEGFVSLNPAANEKTISLKNIFASQVVDKADRKKLRNRKKKEKAKQRPAKQAELRVRLSQEEEEMASTEYRHSANRTIIGRTVNGCQSLLAGRGTAVGYIAVNDLPKIIANFGKASLVLFRNATSRYYHPAYLSIVELPLDI